MSILVLVLYSLALAFIVCYSLVQLHLAIRYLISRKREKKGINFHPKHALPEELPFVTVQLPIYNEMYVIERLLDAVAAFEYPKDKFEVQVLDDSTDETVAIVSKKVEALLENGLQITHVRRPERVGFKAGALQYGLGDAKGEFIAIFDADFLPAPDFLQKTLPYFSDTKTGVVQTRWQHLNENYSILTKMQAFALDAHFSVEQRGRNAAGCFINFNGTAGVWRRAAIDEAGGWEADTLTEDLDLSYRAQLKGWKFRYIEEVGSPAELPAVMNAIKSQQFRWTKGAAEVARKNLGKVFRADVSFKVKLHALFHLINSSIFICILLLGLLTLPLLFVKVYAPQYNLFFQWAKLGFMGTIAMFVFFMISRARAVNDKEENFFTFFLMFPLFMMVSTGLALHNAWAVIEGFVGFKSPFIRTPKYNIKNLKDTWKGKKYGKQGISVMTVLEGLLFLYFVAGGVLCIILGDIPQLVFQIMLMVGFGTIFFYSLYHSRAVAG